MNTVFYFCNEIRLNPKHWTFKCIFSKEALHLKILEDLEKMLLSMVKMCQGEAKVVLTFSHGSLGQASTSLDIFHKALRLTPPKEIIQLFSDAELS